MVKTTSQCLWLEKLCCVGVLLNLVCEMSDRRVPSRISLATHFPLHSLFLICPFV